MFGLYSLDAGYVPKKQTPSGKEAREERVKACYTELKEKSAQIVGALARHASTRVRETFTRKVNEKIGEEARFLESGTGRTLMEMFTSRFAQFTLKQVVHDQLQEKTTNKVKTKYEKYIDGKTPEQAAEAIVADLAPDIEQMVRSPRSGLSQSMVDFTESVVRNLPLILESMPAAEQARTARALKEFFESLSEDLRELSEDEGDISGEIIGAIFAQNLQIYFPDSSPGFMRFMGQCIQEMRLRKEMMQGVSSDAVARIITDDPVKAEMISDDIEFFKREISSLFSHLTKDALRECADIIDQKVFHEKIPYINCTLCEFLESPSKQWLAKKILSSQWGQKKLLAKLQSPGTEEEIQKKIADVTAFAKKIIAKMVVRLPSQEAIDENLGRLRHGVEVFSFSTSLNHRGHVVAAAAETVREINALPPAFDERAEGGEVQPVGEMLEEIAAPMQRFMQNVAVRTEAVAARSKEQNQSWTSWAKSWFGY